MRQEGAEGESLCDYSYLGPPHSEFTADAGWAMLRHTKAKARWTRAEAMLLHRVQGQGPSVTL
jgi:hypothetical protein